MWKQTERRQHESGTSEAAPEPGSSVLEVPAVPSRGQEGKQTVGRMEGVISNKCCFLEAQIPVDVSNRRAESSRSFSSDGDGVLKPPLTERH